MKRFFILTGFLLLFSAAAFAQVEGEKKKEKFDGRTLDPVARRKLVDMANKGNAKAAFLVGAMYEKGDGAPKDTMLARRYYQAAEVGGIIAASYRLGLLDSDAKTAQAYYKKAAEKDYVPAMTAYGKTLVQDDMTVLANEWYTKACRPAKDYDPEACYILALHLEKSGKAAEAYPFFKKAANDHHLPATEKVGDYLLAEKDYAAAFRMYQTAATGYLIGEDQQRLLDKRNEAGKHLLDEERKEIILDVSK